MSRKGEPNKASGRLHLSENICGTKCKMRFFGPHCIDSEGGVMPFNAQMAVVSHYFHNRGYATEDVFKEKAKGLLIDMGKTIFDETPETEGEDLVSESPTQLTLFSDFFDVPFPCSEHPKFTFIDLFAGIGGFRLALQELGGRCVFSSEWDEQAQKTYLLNYGEVPFGDITKEETKSYIPDGFDILCAGFPCQPFSIAGVSKKNSLGRKTGFEDKTQGTLFFDVCKVLKDKRPKAFFLENVKNLRSHDKGKTFKIILETLEELDYEVFHEVLDGQILVPQHRERIYIIGFDRKRYGSDIDFKFKISPLEPKPTLSSILEKKVDDKYTLSDKLWAYLQNYAQKHKAAGNGFGYGIAPQDGITRTLSARYYKDGSEILIEQGGKNPRRLTPRECARLQGYPDKFIIPVHDTQAYRQFGNSVVVPLIKSIADLVEQKICQLDKAHKATYKLKSK